MSGTRRTPHWFSGLLPFVHTAELRSFKGAAEHMGISVAAVSKSVAKLERELGVRLLTRTSRSVAPTPEGELLLARGRTALATLQDAHDLVIAARSVAKGELRVTIPFILGPVVMQAMPALARRQPGLSVRLLVTDRWLRMTEGEIDVAIRVGELPDSSLVARRLRTTRWCTLASPAYLAREGTPATVAELATHECLRFLAPNGRPRDWTFATTPGRAGTSVATRGRFVVDQGELLLDGALAGLGVCQVLDFMAEPHLRAGRLVEVLREHAAEGPAIQAVTTASRRGTAGVKAFIAFLGEALAP
jgi:LysR family transcriptional regulator for bpeEF and oprC